MRNGFRLLVFDWDGTLMDSVAAIVGCMQQATRDAELSPLPDGVIRRTIGLGLRDAQEAMGFAGEPELWRRLVELYRHHWLRTFRDRPLLFPGAAEALRSFHRQGYLLAVATGKSRRGLERDLAATGLGELFAATRTVDESFGKPHPGMLLGLLDELGARREETLMIGDTTFDLEMAANAGTGAVAVCSGSHPRAELQRQRPLACLESVAELEAWLLGRSGGAP